MHAHDDFEIMIPKKLAQRSASAFRTLALGAFGFLLGGALIFVAAIVNLPEIAMLPGTLTLMIAACLYLVGLLSVTFLRAPAPPVATYQRKMRLGLVVSIVGGFLEVMGQSQGIAMVEVVGRLAQAIGGYLVLTGWAGVTLNWGMLAGSALMARLGPWINRSMQALYVFAFATLITLQFAPAYVLFPGVLMMISIIFVVGLLGTASWATASSIKSLAQIL